MVAVWVGVMVLGLIGMIVCGKMQKSNPAMQPISIILFLVVLAGAVMWLRASNIFGGGSRGIIDNELTYYGARGTGIGKLLSRNAAGKKVLVLVDPNFEQDIFSKRLVEDMKKEFTGEVVVGWADVPTNFAETGASYQDIANAKKLGEVIDKNSPGVIVSLTGLPSDAPRMKIFSSQKGQIPVILVGIGSANRRFVAAQLKSGGIIAVIEGKRSASGNSEAPRDPEKAFNELNTLYTKDNVADFK